MRRYLATFGLMLVGLGFSQPAAANFACNGTVSTSYVTYVGGVFLSSSWRGDYTQICNISETWNNIPPEVCATWIAKVDAAVSLQRTMTVYYAGTGDCSTLPTYGGAPGPIYVMLQ